MQPIKFTLIRGASLIGAKKPRGQSKFLKLHSFNIERASDCLVFRHFLLLIIKTVHKRKKTKLC